MSTIYEDTRQHVRGIDKHRMKHDWWAAHGIRVERRALETGDYMADGSNVTVDTKASMDELSGNLGRQHNRFGRECERARKKGCRLVVLVEDGTLDAWGWTNGMCRKCRFRVRYGCHPRFRGEPCVRFGTAKPMQGDTAWKIMRGLSRDYGVRFEFCKPGESAERICELLGVPYE